MFFVVIVIIAKYTKFEKKLKLRVSQRENNNNNNKKRTNEANNLFN